MPLSYDEAVAAVTAPGERFETTTATLTVAEQVTMMHDGRVVVEGTPAEIRANQMVHDIYLGSRFTDE